MPSLFQMAETLDRKGWRRPIAAAASAAMKLRGDERRFEVDDQGRWVNRQPAATFVSPDLHTAHYEQVHAMVLDYWCGFYRPRAGDTVVDVGAGIGEDAIVFGDLVGPTGRVIAIEAHPRTYSALESTVERSGRTNIKPVQRAISDQDGVVMISDSEAHLANSIISANDSGLRVQAQCLDSLADELGLQSIALLKMNIEGSERLAVRGMTRIAPSVRNIAVSCHDFIADDGGDDAFRTIEDVGITLEQLGFTLSRRTDAATAWTRDVLFGTRQG